MPQKEPASYLELVWDALHDATLILLIACAIISLILGFAFEEHPEEAWVDGVAILVAVAVVVNVTAGNDYVKARQFLKMNALSANAKVSVTRYAGGAREIKPILGSDLLVGDLVNLHQGDAVMADGYFLSGSGLRMDEVRPAFAVVVVVCVRRRPSSPRLPSLSHNNNRVPSPVSLVPSTRARLPPSLLAAPRLPRVRAPWWSLPRASTRCLARSTTWCCTPTSVAPPRRTLLLLLPPRALLLPLAQVQALAQVLVGWLLRMRRLPWQPRRPPRAPVTMYVPQRSARVCLFVALCVVLAFRFSHRLSCTGV